ncbi:MAG: hypothetical protein Q8S84_05415 [bacterium]|nr:hypothetical protein [bacterium]MDP3380929.1 hypothetical protein [bacterium]
MLHFISHLVQSTVTYFLSHQIISFQRVHLDKYHGANNVALGSVKINGK